MFGKLAPASVCTKITHVAVVGRSHPADDGVRAVSPGSAAHGHVAGRRHQLAVHNSHRRQLQPYTGACRCLQVRVSLLTHFVMTGVCRVRMVYD